MFTLLIVLSITQLFLFSLVLYDRRKKPEKLPENEDYLNLLNNEFPFNDFLETNFMIIPPDECKQALILLQEGMSLALNKHHTIENEIPKHK